MKCVTCEKYVIVRDVAGVLGGPEGERGRREW